MKPKICILDYGSGNVTSVKNSLDRLDIDNLISNAKSDINDASHLILPGVGAFKASMEKINQKLPISLLKTKITQGKPLLGICVGMQVFAENGFEFGVYPGLGFFQGSEVIEIGNEVLKPHVGWNSINIEKEHSILREIEDGSDFYFVHSYHISRIEKTNIVASCDYGVKFPAIIAKDNLLGVQFHPEKSQQNGDKLLRNFVETYS